MCGICGIVDFSGRTIDPVERDLLTRRMLKRLHHRGPDHSDVYSDSIASIGVARLSVLDRSVAGNQPMRSSSGRYVQAFNGEIYNCNALRTSMENRGATFASHSDTEVLLSLFEAYGEACLNDLRGMFAFAVWDRESRSLFLARDRAGEKPLVYSYHNGCFAFASEIGALLELPWISREPDWVGIHHGIHFIHIPAPHSAFKDISKLPPATSLTVNDNGLAFNRYWKLRFDQKYGPDDKDKCCRDIIEELDEITSLMSHCDVPVGTFLSGGLDSSSVTASLANVLSGFPTFRISHPGPEDEKESAAAAEVASRYGTKHNNLSMRPDILHNIRDFVATHGEPTGTMVALDYYRLANMASKQVTVILSGNGADEMFGGYDLNVMEEIDRSRVHWAALREILGDQGTHSSSQSGLMDFASRMREIDARGPQLLYADRYLTRGRSFASSAYTPQMTELTSRHNPEQLMVDRYIEADTGLLFNATVYQMLNLTCQYSLVDHSDACAMASSLEVRSPFLDVRMMELAASIPPAWKVGQRGNEQFGKMILREAMAKRLPDSARFGVKLGFGGTVPYGDWLRNEWDNVIDRDALAATGMFDVQKIDQMVQHDLREQPKLAHMLFNILTIGTWYSMYNNSTAPRLI